GPDRHHAGWQDYRRDACKRSYRGKIDGTHGARWAGREGAMTQAIEQGGRRIDWARLLVNFGPLIFLAALMIVFTVMSPNFIDPLNLFNIMRQVSITGLLALGMTFVILTAGIDLSVGSLLALCGMVGAVVAKGGAANTLSLSASGSGGYGWF